MPFTSHPVFNRPPNGQKLWRFMDFPRFFYLMSRRQLYLPSLATLNDPWEGMPPRMHLDPQLNIPVGTSDSKDIKSMSQEQVFGGPERFSAYASIYLRGVQDLRKNTFVNCWHMNDTESEALWTIYGGRNYGICIQTTYERLEAAIAQDRGIYAGTVTYLDETRELLGDGNNIFYNCVWKRKSFEHEREFRIVVCRHDTGAAGISLKVDIAQLIDRIVVHPLAEDWFAAIVKDFVASSGCTASVERSTLLAPPAY
jgi:hypothetical protein